jgi:hypothetical protein
MRRIRLSRRGRRELLDREHSICHLCAGIIQPTDRWEVSHEIPLALGGDDDTENRRAAHYKCHRVHTARKDVPLIAKSRRIQDRHRGVTRARNPMPGSKDSGWKKTFSRGWVRRKT